VSAEISADGRYRYTLEREWMTGEGTCLFVMLNPSTADATEDDPTIRRCVKFAQRWGYQRLAVGNLYAFRATDPDDLWKPDGPVGEYPCCAGGDRHNRNDHHIEELAAEADRVVVAWGANPGPIEWRRARVLEILAQSHGAPVLCLGTTANGSPTHPLARGRHRVPDDVEPQPYDLSSLAVAA
jgi:hypothetical protein